MKFPMLLQHLDYRNQFWVAYKYFYYLDRGIQFLFSCGRSKDFLRIQMQIVDGGADFTNIDRQEQDRSYRRTALVTLIPLPRRKSTALSRTPLIYRHSRRRREARMKPRG